MSRSTVDLQSVRVFLGYGLIFMLQSGLTIVLAAVAMFLTEPGLAAISSRRCHSSCSSRRATGAARGRRCRVPTAERRLTADVEENLSGVRVVKAFAREAASSSASAGRSDASSTSRW